MSEGDCYHVAAVLVAFEGFPGLVCHGEATGQGAIEGVRFGHAWVEVDDTVFDFSNGGSHVLPRDRYYALGEIDEKEVRRYTKDETLAWMLKTHHYGPWDE